MQQQASVIHHLGIASYRSDCEAAYTLQVIHACALELDLQILPAGDQSMAGKSPPTGCRQCCDAYPTKEEEGHTAVLALQHRFGTRNLSAYMRVTPSDASSQALTEDGSPRHSELGQPNGLGHAPCLLHALPCAICR
jgi:hypothetical protein